jgi:hypothetical protein
MDRIHATPFDNDAISLILQGRVTSFRLAAQVDSYLQRCSKESKNIYNNGCDFINYAPDLSYIIDLKGDLTRFIPDLSRQIDGVLENYNPKSSGLISLQERIISIYPQIIPEYKRNYVISTYSMHILFIAALIAILFWRKQVGDGIIKSLFYPVKLAVHGLRLIHRKI